MTLAELTERIDGYLQNFREPRMFDESTVRKKLKEYVSEGIIEAEKRGKTVCYRRTGADFAPDPDLLDFFSEAAPCGVIGSYLLDKAGPHEARFAFKHHYITGVMDSEIICSLLTAMGEKKYITMETINRRKDRITENHVVPLRLMMSAQNGRQHLMAYTPRFGRINSFRTDNIVSVHVDGPCERFDELRGVLPALQLFGRIDEELVAPDALIREFIGGGIYEY